MNGLFRKFGMTAVIAMATLFPSAAGKVTLASGSKTKMPIVEVDISNFTFNSMDLAVPVGTTVTWVNKDDVPHTVVSTDKVFASPALDTDDKFSYTFTRSGTYPYFCSVHPRMMARIVVK